LSHRLGSATNQSFCPTNFRAQSLNHTIGKAASLSRGERSGRGNCWFGIRNLLPEKPQDGTAVPLNPGMHASCRINLHISYHEKDCSYCVTPEYFVEIWGGAEAQLVLPKSLGDEARGALFLPTVSNAVRRKSRPRILPWQVSRKGAKIKDSIASHRTKLCFLATAADNAIDFGWAQAQKLSVE
jgi:hypothetical protein